MAVHVSSAHPFTDNRIHYRECRSLCEAGFEITLIAIESDVKGEATDVDVITLPARRRLKRMILSGAQAISKAIRVKARIVHLHDPELIPYIPLLRLLGRVVIYDAHEDLPVQVLDKPYGTRVGRFVLAGAARLLLAVARQANLVIAATETIAQRFPERKTAIVRNYPPLRAEEQVLPGIESRQDFAIYIGAMSETRGTLELLKAAYDPAFPAGWMLHLAGPVSRDLEPIIDDAVRGGRVVYHGKVSPIAARDLLLSAKVGIVTLRNTTAYRHSLPTKLFEYFAAGLPVVASDFPLWRRIVEGAGGGLLVDETNPAAIASAVAKYADSSKTWERFSVSAREAATKSLNWTKEGDVLVAAYRRL